MLSFNLILKYWWFDNLGVHAKHIKNRIIADEINLEQKKPQESAFLYCFDFYSLMIKAINKKSYIYMLVIRILIIMS